MPLQIITAHEFLRIARGQQNLDVRLQLPGARSYLTARYAARHDEVSQDEIDGLALSSEVERLGALTRFHNLTSDQFEARNRQLADAVIVLNHKNGFVCIWVADVCGFGERLGSRSTHPREVKIERSTVTNLAVNRDMAPDCLTKP